MTTPPRAHIAMFSIAAHGHVNPSLEVIRELVGRGHRVSYAVPASFADTVAATGAEPVVYTSTLPTRQEDWGSELIDHIEPFLDDAVQALPQLADAFAGDEPDLVLHDITAYPARVLAHRWGVPAVQLWPNMVPWEGYAEEVGEPRNAEVRRTERGRAYFERFADWLAVNGLGDLSSGDFVARPRRGLVLIPEALQPNADRVDHARFTFVGACQGERADQGEWKRPADAEKVLLVSLGSSFTGGPAFYRECVEAFGGLPGWHVVLQIGAQVDPADLGHVPPNIEVHPWVPQLSVLKQADAFITHAGAGGSQEGLATGTPMVAVPQAVDQFGNADMLQSLGVARHLPKEEADAASLRAAVLALADDPDVAARLTLIRGRMAEEGGTGRAADLIEAELPA
ncbi:macrolide-inactivating glycosyltransferase [Streptomyces sp. NPDC052071]|uniref:Glycosyltransferase, MGT family n=1 Tax=Streptomyces pratensis (strain ATCC 33331 / IAF-45CD) TaxID=591167 RepID=A0A8D3WEY6_STRFA|nr:MULTISPECIES: macrolide-inactivating glycosyltransferase [Streptomyces]MDX2619311.1 macrolide-inactivating glycosyltransferase [Streptomyces sp. WI03-5b]MDX3179829.1 macrolide-inactivating glycosyltransferase [Streptomyces sp. ME02-7008A-1]MDX3300570.1 macrolide-inactivating glycosyltransferase [Streptomyces sp. ME02-7008A]MYT50011.1 macrolide-inactivating glycosyltransferase [Streptomyces sp. SID7815]WSZ51204.1 macrolide-inactivating glycosyltransferase [[Kitasatospora] papulosa]